MSSLENLYRLLEPLRIYALRGDSLIDCELAAYGAGFAIIESMLEDSRESFFIQTATGGALALHETASGLPVRETAPEDERRALILARRRPLPPCDRDGMLEALCRSGLIFPGLEEFPEEKRLLIRAEGIASGLSGETVWHMALGVLPAHLYPETLGASWQELDSLNHTWDQRDATGISWAEFALCGARSL